MRETDKQFHFAKTNCNFLWLFSYFYYILEQAKILILCLKSQINSEGELEWSVLEILIVCL